MPLLREDVSSFPEVRSPLQDARLARVERLSVRRPVLSLTRAASFQNRDVVLALPARAALDRDVRGSIVEGSTSREQIHSRDSDVVHAL